ncbi:MAG: hypothetical protein Fur0037_22660 [Planctomycetota bacterium]
MRPVPLPERRAPLELDDYDVCWTAPGSSSADSMPIGNGEVGCNAWVDGERGELRLLLSRTDSFSEASRLLKAGLVRLRFSPNPFEKGAPFVQTLHLDAGAIRVLAGDVDRALELRLYVDCASDVVFVTGTSAAPLDVEVLAETWRKAPKRLLGQELDSSWTMKEAPADVEVRESADRRLSFLLDTGSVEPSPVLGWFHRNETSVVGLTLRHQGLESAVSLVEDPLLHRAFGVAMQAPSLEADEDANALRGRVARFSLRVAVPCVQDPDPDAFAHAAAGLLRAADPDAAFLRTAAWWDAFWARSWVFAKGDPERPLAIPPPVHPLRLGVDSEGGNRLFGSIEDLEILGPSGDLLFAASPGRELPLVAEKAPSLDRGFLIRARVRLDAGHPIGRIADRITAGRGDGFLFDTHPGESLRLIVGERKVEARGVLPCGEEHLVEALCDPASGTLRLSVDGAVVGEDPPDWSNRSRVPSRLTQALVLQRWVQASGGRGEYPIKFNGSIFTVEPSLTNGAPFDADWRRWGDCFWWQNTRLPYHPMLAQGDLEMLEPLFALYERALPICEERARLYHGARGAAFPETMTLFGTYGNRDYGWNREGKGVGDVACLYWRFAWNQGLELLALMLDRNDYSPDWVFARDRLLPMADRVLSWFESRFPRGDDGRLLISPTQALETYWYGVEDDMPSVAGLRDVLPRLLALPKSLLGERRARAWRELLAAIPEIPRERRDGAMVLAPARRYDSKRNNIENPELYAVFPFRLFGVGRPELDLARATFERRREKRSVGWTQDGICAALLGLVEPAKADVLARIRNSHPRHRFPVMWGPNFDWLPDQCHGGNLLTEVQAMLLQPVGQRLLLLPAWPLEWNVSFRLHAPRDTVVELEYRGGRIARFLVIPPSRRADIELPEDLAGSARDLGAKTFAR